MTKVYVVSNGGHDYSNAEAFGEIVFCTQGLIHKNNISQMYREISEAMQDARAGDYILVTALSSLCMVAASIMADRFGEVHFLLYDNGEYIARDLVLESRHG